MGFEFFEDRVGEADVGVEGSVVNVACGDFDFEAEVSLCAYVEDTVRTFDKGEEEEEIAILFGLDGACACFFGGKQQERVVGIGCFVEIADDPSDVREIEFLVVFELFIEIGVGFELGLP